jgi:hypothetical protein
MPPQIQEVIRIRVVQQWLGGEARDKIASDLQIGAGTVSNIVSEFKIGLENSEFDSIRQLALEIRRQQLNWSDLASHFRLYNYLVKSGAVEDKIESFIDNVNSGNLPAETIIELVYQLHEISKTELIPLDHIPIYIQGKLEEKKKIDEQIKEAASTLQTKNVNLQAINEHLQLNEKLKERGLSTEDIEKLVNFIDIAKEYGFDSKKIVGKLRSIKRTEKKEERLRNNCEILSKQLTKYKEIIPLAELVHSMHISGRELMLFKAALNEAAETYGLTPSAAALDVINLIIDHSKKGRLKRELSELSFEKYAIDRFCSSNSQVINALMNLRSHGITNEQIILLNNFLESNGYKTTAYTSTKYCILPQIRNFSESVDSSYIAAELDQ